MASSRLKELAAALYTRRELVKAVLIEVLSQDNKQVIKRFRFVPPEKGHRFNPEGVERCLNNFIFRFDSDNPNHKYRLVELKGHAGRDCHFRLVHEVIKCKGADDCKHPALANDLCRRHLNAKAREDAKKSVQTFEDDAVIAVVPTDVPHKRIPAEESWA